MQVYKSFAHEERFDPLALDFGVIGVMLSVLPHRLKQKTQNTQPFDPQTGIPYQCDEGSNFYSRVYAQPEDAALFILFAN